DVRSDSYMTLSYVAALLGSSGARVQPASTGPSLLAVGTAGQSQIPDSSLKGGLWLLPPNLQGDVSLEPAAIEGLGWHLRPQEVDLDWLGRDVLTGRLSDPNTQNVILTAKGAVLVLGWQ